MAKNIKKYYSIEKKKKIVNMIIAVATILAVSIVLITIYAQNVGNFIIGVEADVRLSLSLSETSEFTKPVSRLTAPGLKEQTHATLTDIPENITEGYGSKNDDVRRRYFAYTFYIKNVSSVIMDYDVDIILNKSTKGAESAIRVMVIKNDITEIYAKAKEYPAEQAGMPEDHIGTAIEVPYMTKPFESLSTVMYQTERNFLKDAVNKYTIVIWIEGWDHECVDEIKGGIVRMEMRFKANY